MISNDFSGARSQVPLELVPSAASSLAAPSSISSQVEAEHENSDPIKRRKISLGDNPSSRASIGLTSFFSRMTLSEDQDKVLSQADSSPCMQVAVRGDRASVLAALFNESLGSDVPRMDQFRLSQRLNKASVGLYSRMGKGIKTDQFTIALQCVLAGIAGGLNKNIDESPLPLKLNEVIANLIQQSEGRLHALRVQQRAHENNRQVGFKLDLVPEGDRKYRQYVQPFKLAQRLELQYDHLFVQDQGIKVATPGQYFENVLDVAMDHSLVIDSQNGLIGTSFAVTCTAVCARGYTLQGRMKLGVIHSSGIIEAEEVLKSLQKKMTEAGCVKSKITMYLLGGRLVDPQEDPDEWGGTVDTGKEYLAHAEKYNIVAVRLHRNMVEDEAVHVVMTPEQVIYSNTRQIFTPNPRGVGERL